MAGPVNLLSTRGYEWIRISSVDELPGDWTGAEFLFELAYPEWKDSGPTEILNQRTMRLDRSQLQDLAHWVDLVRDSLTNDDALIRPLVLTADMTFAVPDSVDHLLLNDWQRPVQFVWRFAETSDIRVVIAMDATTMDLAFEELSGLLG